MSAKRETKHKKTDSGIGDKYKVGKCVNIAILYNSSDIEFEARSFYFK